MLVKGRGEQLQSIPPLRSLDGAGLFDQPPLASTAWAYQSWRAFPQLQGQEGALRQRQKLFPTALADVSDNFTTASNHPF